MGLTKEAVTKIIEEQINPALALHNGGAEMIDVLPQENEIVIRLYGGCSGCPSSHITLFNGIVPIFQEHFPDVNVSLDF